MWPAGAQKLPPLTPKPPLEVQDFPAVAALLVGGRSGQAPMCPHPTLPRQRQLFAGSPEGQGNGDRSEITRRGGRPGWRRRLAVCGWKGPPPGCCGDGPLTGGTAEERQASCLDFTEGPHGLRPTAGLTDVREANSTGAWLRSGPDAFLSISRAFPILVDMVTGPAGHAGMDPDPRGVPSCPRLQGTRTMRFWLHLALLWGRGAETEIGEEEQGGEVQGA